MKKKIYPLNYDNELDLIDLSKVIWDGKIKILLIIIISCLVGLGYYYQTPKNYLSSLTISKSDNFNFDEIINIQKSIFIDETNQALPKNKNFLNNQRILIKFINELKDYEEFLVNLKNVKIIRENIYKLKIEDQKSELFKYVKLLEIVKPHRSKDIYILNFKWHDTDEAKKIIQDSLKLILNNFEKKIFEELKQSLEIRKKYDHIKNKERSNYLKDQRWIAKELNISEPINGYTGKPHYLRGYLAIDKEIELIKNSKNEHYEFIKKEIDALKEIGIKWIDYNIYLIEIKSLKNTKKIFMITILLGLIVGVFYILIFSEFKKQIISKKRMK
jgi:LPS O-antigen subunit length determinant protein (WzzB/FepE family)